jgi:hypothetical protein
VGRARWEQDLAQTREAGQPNTHAALGCDAQLAIEPARVVAALIELIDLFDEFDPDQAYDGPHARIWSALKSFGPEAAPAVPKLIEELRLQPEGSLAIVLETLTAIGTAARPALTVIRELAESWGENLERDANWYMIRNAQALLSALRILGPV